MSGSGLSASRLATMREVLTRHVARGDVPGLVALVARRGEVHAEAIGTSPVPPVVFRDFWTCAYQAIED